MNHLPSRSTDPALHEWMEQRDGTKRRTRQGRTRSFPTPNQSTVDTDIRPLLHLVKSTHRQPAILALLEHGMGQYYGAEPLAPLRDRDLRVLDAWFTAAEMQEIAADIAENLQNRHPEPCWDDFAPGFLDSYR